jgi:bacterioferritin
MAKDHDRTSGTTLPRVERKPMALDEAAIEAARHSPEQGAAAPSSGPWRSELIELLNDCLGTEPVCVLRYRRHHVTAQVRPVTDSLEPCRRHGGLGHTRELPDPSLVLRRTQRCGTEPDPAKVAEPRSIDKNRPVPRTARARARHARRNR